MAVLVPVYLVALRLLVAEPDVPVRRGLRRAVREWPAWLAYASVETAYLVVHWLSSGQAGKWPGLGGVAGFVVQSWWKGFVPSLAGLGLSPHRPPWELAMPEAALAGLVLWSVIRRPRAWRAWAFLAMAFVVNSFLLSLGQVGQIHAHDALQLRYYPESTYLFCMVLAAALLDQRVGGRALAARGSAGTEGQGEIGPGESGGGTGHIWGRVRSWVAPWRGRHRAGLGAALAAAALGAHLGLSWVTDQRARTLALGPGLHADVARLAAGLDRARAQARGEPTVLGGEALSASPSVWMEASNRDLLRLLDPMVTFDRPSPRLFVLGFGARFQRVWPTGTPVGGQAQALTRTGVLQVAFGRVSAGAGAVCIAAGTSASELSFVPRDGLPGGRWYLQLSYSSARAYSLSLTVTTRSEVPLPALSVDLARGSGSVLVSLRRPPSIGGLALDVPAGSRLCVSSLTVGQLAPRPA